MEKEYVVIDEDGNVSYSLKDEAPEKFRTFKAARARAELLAKFNPGQPIRIYELTAEAFASVEPVETKRAHPLEHYK